MVETFLQGALVGFSMSIIFIGPALFALIQTSIKHGFRSAAAMAIGISLSDVILVFLAYLGAAQFLDNPRVKIYEGIIGSAVMFIFGIYELFQKHVEEKDAVIGIQAIANLNKRLPLMFVKGFFLNILNPIIFLTWIVCMSNVSSHYNTGKEILLFFAGTLGMVLFLDLLKSLAANSVKKLLTPKLMKFIHYIMAIALIISGIVLIFRSF